MLKSGINQKQNITTFKIAATYIGTVVGAGFASGQEVLQFFGYYGLTGFGGLLITTLLFVIYGFIIMKLGLAYRAGSHREVIHYAAGKWLGLLIDLIITFFLFGAFTAMVAGSGAIFSEQFGLPVLWGNIFMMIAALLTVLLGIKGVINSISFVVPFLLTGVISLALLTVINKWPISLSLLQYSAPAKAPVPHWILSAVVYASYNLLIAVAVLAPLGAEAEEKAKIKRGSILGGLGLGIGAAAILTALLLNMPGTTAYEIPMVYIAGKFTPLLQFIYSGILLAEIYTTAVGNLFGFVIRITGKNGTYYRTIVIITAVVGLVASRFGFSNLVHYLYPVVGYAGILMMIGLSVGMLREFT